MRTVLGDVAPDELGVTFAHEHLIIDSETVVAKTPEISLPSVDEAVAEVERCVAAGVRTMIDAMPIGAGRNPNKLAAVGSATGINIVMATGVHLPMFYEGWQELADATADLAAWFVADIAKGADRHDRRGRTVERSAIRAGVIKIATRSDPLDSRDQTLVRAAADAHLETGAPILTHCEGGRGGLAQVEAFSARGVATSHLVLSHTDKVLDLQFHRDLLESGVNVEYDQALRQPAGAERGTAWLIAEMVESGFGSQIMLGTDGARRSLWSTLGGEPGLAWLATGFVEELRQRGHGQADLDEMFITTPARCFAFAERRRA